MIRVCIGLFCHPRNKIKISPIIINDLNYDDNLQYHVDIWKVVKNLLRYYIMSISPSSLVLCHFVFSIACSNFYCRVYFILDVYIYPAYHRISIVDLFQLLIVNLARFTNSLNRSYCIIIIPYHTRHKGNSSPNKSQDPPLKAKPGNYRQIMLKYNTYSRNRL